MKIHLKDICHLAERVEGNAENAVISAVTKDTRNVSPQSLYVPIAGERFDGHNFLLDAIKKGSVASLWKQGTPVPEGLPEDFVLLMVEDTVLALGHIAKWYLKKVHPVVIGVTGSNGKTTVKDMVESVASTTFATFKTQGNYNNHIGLPLTILSMEETTEVLILEMGMSGFGEISYLSKLAEPDVAIVTNIGESHMEQLGSREGIAKAKLEIKDGLKESGLLVVDGDEPLLKNQKGDNVLSVGFSTEASFHITSIESGTDGFTFQLEEGTTVYKVPVLGKHNVKNAAYAIAVAHYLNIEENKINEGLNSLNITNMRLQASRGRGGALLINDAYNASPTSMMAALETLAGLEGFERKVAVLGDMYELGSMEEEMHRKVAQKAGVGIDIVITVGPRASWIADELEKTGSDSLKVYAFPAKEDAASLLSQLMDKKTAILFKASRGMSLETLVNEFSADEQETKK
ncbi:UDP-N-acetylmuramoyl-tripeptide--D-alanyl-D-alanine ligase [Fictibacillus aquaticus]|uniref:UDP-N-acetylmuramoyl-tripeptide--D-alanyl-D-alanine ligase n=1 Tax=Fictibacillus aquaticus TaxID=2021314 RepID=A0A235FCA2_9BACL|nr:UDP-N-acetylmuramoyl-tripeptide--D-alanyl-D-alanine ligase [Fictibacillus aquaticus]OYD58946.1 UDP-N-acetylmuramoylalanyl-D-glutamate--2,6-diaminopimelate ligase [Fictibacillus aquaticus]